MPLPTFRTFSETYEHGPLEHELLQNVKAVYNEEIPTHPDIAAEHASLLEDHKPVTAKYEMSVRRYTGNDSKELNTSLITKGEPELIHQSMHNNLMKLHEESPALKRTHHVYSSTGSFDPGKVVKEDGVFTTPAHISTTLHPGIAAAKANAQDTGLNDQHILHFELPTGYKHGSYLAGHSQYRHEKEYLIKPKTKWKVKNKTTFHVGENGQKRHVWHVVPHESELQEAASHTDGYFNGKITYGYDSQGNHGIMQHVGWSRKGHEFSYDHQDVERQHKQLVTQHRIPSKDEDAVQQIKDYTAGSSKVNRSLIKPGLFSFGNGPAKKLSGVIGKYTKPLQHDTHVYSGLSNFDPSDHFRKGKGTIHLPAFTSTSLHPSVALNFAPHDPETGISHIIHFHLPAGYKKGLYIDGRSHVRGEREMLLDKGQTWKLKEPPKQMALKVGYKNLNDPRFQNHTREVTLWSVEPHTRKLNEATYHDPKVFHQAEAYGKKKTPAADFMTDRKYATMYRLGQEAKEHEQTMLAHGPTRDDLKEGSEHHHLAREINRYTGASSTMINRHLLGKGEASDPQSLTHRADTLSKAIEHFGKPLEHEAHVYSGIGGFNPAEHFKEDNGVFHMPAFTSTSLNPMIAHSFAHSQDKPLSHSFISDMHVIHFHLPKGYKKGCYVNGVSQCNGEYEYLLDKGQKWKLKGHSVHNDVSYSTSDGAKNIAKRKVHVWSVEPHEDSLKEAFEHEPRVYQNSMKNAWSFQAKPMTAAHNAMNNIAGQIRDNVLDDVMRHHKKMVEYGPPKGENNEHIDSIKNYTGSESDPINKHLLGNTLTNFHSSRKEAEEHWEGKAAELDDAIKHYAKPLDHEAHVYSGIGGFDPAEHFKYGNGTIHMPSFVSTSIDPDTAQNFAHRRPKAPGHSFSHDYHIIHFHLPKGYDKGVYAENCSLCGGEKEYILNRDQKWKLKDHTVHNSIQYKSDSGAHKKKVHVWSVEPHEENVQELFDHKPELLHLLSFTNKSSKPMPWAGNLANQSTRFKRDQASDLSDHHHAVMREFGPNKTHLRSSDPYHEHYAKQLREYTDDSSNLNEHLLGNTQLQDVKLRPIADKQDAKEYWDNTADVTSKALHHFAKPLDHEAHVYSGLGSFDPRKKFHEGNGVIHMPAFVSSSLNPHIARGFAYKQDNWNDNSSFQHETHIMHFKLPQGYKKGVYMNNVSVTPGEHEYLLDKGQKWKLTGHSVHNHVEYTKHDQGHMKVSTKVHVWSVVPHHDDMKEAYEHDPSHFHDVGDETHANFASMGSESHPWDDKEEHGMHGFNAWNKSLNGAKNEYHDSDAMKAEHKHLEERSRAHYEAHGPGPYSKEFTISGHGLIVKNHGHEALLDYTAHSKDLNTGLLAMSKGHEHNHITKTQIEMNAENTSQGIKEHAAPLKQTLHVYSGTGSYNPSKAFREGNGVIHTPTFVSSSISPHVAKQFSRGAYSDKQEPESHVIHFELPEGYKKGAYIAHTSEHPKEHEFLLDRNQHWKLKNHQVVTTRDKNGSGEEEGAHMKRHIWTVVPHDPHLDEAFMHDPSAFHDVGEHPEKNFIELGAKKYADLNDFSKKMHGHSDWYGRNIAKPASSYHDTPEFKAEHEHLVSRASAHYEQHGTQPLNHKIRDFDKGEDTFGHPAIANYTGYSKDLNKTLVKLSSGEDYVPDTTADLLHQSVAQHRAETVSQAIKEHAAPLTQTLHVYSGLKGYHPGRHFLIGNGIIHTPAFTSTSISPHISKIFSLAHKTAKGEPESHILHFELPAGYNRGAYIAGTSHHPSEHEFLLDRNQKWKLKGHHVTTTRDTVGTPNYGQKIRRHVWTVVPHDPDEDKDYGMHEAYDHDEYPLKNHTGYTLDDLDWHGPDSDPKFDEEGEHLSKLHATDHPESHQALEHWSASSHGINRHLIRGDELHEDDRKTHEHMQHLINTAAPLEHAHHVYSSMGTFDPSKLMDSNKTFRTVSYTSTSLNPEIAAAHANGYHRDTHIVHFHLPKGYRGGRYIADHSQYPHEREVVIAPGKKFKMVGHETVPAQSGSTRTIWHAVPHEDDLHEALEHHPHYFKTREDTARSYLQNAGYETHAYNTHYQIHQGLDQHQAEQTMAHHEVLMRHQPENPDRAHTREITSYTRGSGDMNRALISNYNDGVRTGKYVPYHDEGYHPEKAKALSHAINSMAVPLDHEAHVYSGLRSFDPTKHFEMGKGIIHMPAFTSTSISPPVARGFDASGKDKHFIHFVLPKGYKKGLYVEPYTHSAYRGEHEFLLDKGQNWKLISKHTVKSRVSQPNSYRGDANGVKHDSIRRHIWTVVPHNGPVPMPRKTLKTHGELAAVSSAINNAVRKHTPSLAGPHPNPAALRPKPQSQTSHGSLSAGLRAGTWEPEDDNHW
jgi:hypothetical protein